MNGKRQSKVPSHGSPIAVEVIEVRGGECPLEYRPGTQFLVDGPLVPEGMCTWAWNTMLPSLSVLRFGGTLPWEDFPGVIRTACPDPDRTVVFRLSRQG